MFTYLAVQDGDELKDFDQPKPFKCLVLVSEEVSDSWRHAVSDWLVTSGCLYVMAWGMCSSTWDDSVDFAGLVKFDWGNIPDDKFVMTTWHHNEPLEEAMHFAKFAAHHPAVDLEHLFVLDIGNSGRQDVIQKLFDEA